MRNARCPPSLTAWTNYVGIIYTQKNKWHHLIVHKTVPSVTPYEVRGTKIVPFLQKKAPFSKMVAQGHCFSTLFLFECRYRVGLPWVLTVK